MTAEQKAREILYRAGVLDAESYTAGDLVEIANLVEIADRVRRAESRPAVRSAGLLLQFFAVGILMAAMQPTAFFSREVLSVVVACALVEIGSRMRL